MRHAPGEQVLVQEIWRDEVWAARPMTVVQDRDDRVALWFPKGTRWKAPTVPSTRPREASRAERLATCLACGEWVFADAEWDVSTLVLVRPGEWHAVWVSFLEDGAQWGWYVNLQEPLRRTPLGFETMDLVLDVVIDLDGAWRWKDEDELATFVERGVFDDALAAHVRQEGLRVVGRAERNESPFDEGWPDWLPDPTWPLPELPETWDKRCR